MPLDGNGIWQYTEGETASLASVMWNRLASSVSTVVGSILSRLTGLEAQNVTVFALTTTVNNAATTTMTGSRTSGTGATIDAAGNIQFVAQGIYAIDVVLAISGAVTTGRTFAGIQTASVQSRDGAAVGDDTYGTCVAALTAAATSTFQVQTFQTSGAARTVTGTVRVTKVK
jgi:hypothetical protein